MFVSNWNGVHHNQKIVVLKSHFCTMIEAIGDLRVRGNIVLSIPRLKVTLTKCAFPTCNQRNNLHAISLPTRQSLLESKRIYIPKLMKACNDHLKCESWSVEFEERAFGYSYTDQQVEDMVDILRVKSKLKRNETPGKTKCWLFLVMTLKAVILFS